MSTDTPNATVVFYIHRLKERFGVKTDDELAQKLGLSKQAVANWRLRGKIPLRVQQRMLDDFGVGYPEWNLSYDGSDGDVVYAVTLYAFERVRARDDNCRLSIQHRRSMGQVFQKATAAVHAKLAGIKTHGKSADTLIELLISHIDSGRFAEIEALLAEVDE